MRAVVEWLQDKRVDAAYITDPVSIAYLTGFRTDPGERLMALVIRPDRAVLIVPGLERDSAEGTAREVSVVSWRDGEDPYALVAAAVDGTRRLGVEKGALSLAAAEALRDRLGVAEMEDVGPVLRRLRVTKAPTELALLARAGQITDEVTAAVLGQIAAGQTELEIASKIDGLIAAAEAKRSFETIVQSGPNSGQPHLRPQRRQLEKGDLVLLDFGAAWRGYRGDITRVVVVGEPDARQREVHGVVLEAHDRAVEAIRPGVTAGAVDAAARDVIEAAGLGEYFIHRVGHGLGLETHEDPSLDPGSTVELEAGMVVTVEPGVYIPGWGGVRIEDDVVVEAGGARLLTAAPRELRSV
jgi:Xaa-Pro dipeptidase